MALSPTRPTQALDVCKDIVGGGWACNSCKTSAVALLELAGQRWHLKKQRWTLGTLTCDTMHARIHTQLIKSLKPYKYSGYITECSPLQPPAVLFSLRTLVYSALTGSWTQEQQSHVNDSHDIDCTHPHPVEGGGVCLSKFVHNLRTEGLWGGPVPE